MDLGKDYRLINISKSWQLIYEIVKNLTLKVSGSGKIRVNSQKMFCIISMV